MPFTPERRTGTVKKDTLRKECNTTKRYPVCFSNKSSSLFLGQASKSSSNSKKLVYIPCTILIMKLGTASNTQFCDSLDWVLLKAANVFRIIVRRARRPMAENGELGLFPQCFVRKGNVLLSLNDSNVWHIESILNWDSWKCAYVWFLVIARI